MGGGGGDNDGCGRRQDQRAGLFSSQLPRIAKYLLDLPFSVDHTYP
jgi:hypothetical protein